MMIKGVDFREITVHKDNRGWLYEAARRDDGSFRGFGQIYVVHSYGEETRGGHYHAKQWDFTVALSGDFDIVLLDLRPTMDLGDSVIIPMRSDKPQGLWIPPMVWHEFRPKRGSFTALGMPSEPYDQKTPDKVIMTLQQARERAEKNLYVDKRVESHPSWRGGDVRHQI